MKRVAVILLIALVFPTILTAAEKKDDAASLAQAQKTLDADRQSRVMRADKGIAEVLQREKCRMEITATFSNNRPQPEFQIRLIPE